jgi:uroporphyrin-III C-methyltransferase
MTQTRELRAARSADTEVFYMAGKQLAALARGLLDSGWPADTPVSVVSRAGWPDQLHSDHTLQTLPRASLLHAGRPTVVTVGEGARPVVEKPVAAKQAKAPAADLALPVKTPSP